MAHAITVNETLNRAECCPRLGHVTRCQRQTRVLRCAWLERGPQQRCEDFEGPKSSSNPLDDGKASVHLMSKIPKPHRIVVGISGASGAIYGVRLVETLAAIEGVETPLVMSKGAAATISYETKFLPADVAALADVAYDERDLAAAIASGTFLTAAMVVAPCSIRTLSAIANSANDNLLVRAADVHLKERRRLVLVVRETPLHLGHLRLMTEVTMAGGVILPPVPGFYTLPDTIDDLVNHTVGKVLDVIGLTEHSLFPRWNGPENPPTPQ